MEKEKTLRARFIGVYGKSSECRGQNYNYEHY